MDEIYTLLFQMPKKDFLRTVKTMNSTQLDSEALLCFLDSENPVVWNRSRTLLLVHFPAVFDLTTLQGWLQTRDKFVREKVHECLIVGHYKQLCYRTLLYIHRSSDTQMRAKAWQRLELLDLQDVRPESLFDEFLVSNDKDVREATSKLLDRYPKEMLPYDMLQQYVLCSWFTAVKDKARLLLLEHYSEFLENEMLFGFLSTRNRKMHAIVREILEQRKMTVSA